MSESSFGTHVAKLAQVPMDVVERADVISKDFAEKFKEKLQLNQEKNPSAKIPLSAQADFAYLYKVATGQVEEESQNPDHVAEVLRRMKGVVRRYLEIRKKKMIA